MHEPSIILSCPPGIKQIAPSISRDMITVLTLGESKVEAMALTLPSFSMTAPRPNWY